jgi:hypothetical protein
MLASACVEGWANGVGSKDNIKKWLHGEERLK